MFFITGLVAEKNAIPRYNETKFKFVGCLIDVCILYETYVLIQCENAKQSSWGLVQMDEHYIWTVLPQENRDQQRLRLLLRRMLWLHKGRIYRRVVKSIIDLDFSRYYYCIIIIVCIYNILWFCHLFSLNSFEEYF